mmetsp:Transcript_6556/g.6114  ORF Transcript_6556/g.6114 Transcript_6556/m.6114 type:complete len:219 (-) Transcript_6556:41-697(-)
MIKFNSHNDFMSFMLNLKDTYKYIKANRSEVAIDLDDSSDVLITDKDSLIPPIQSKIETVTDYDGKIIHSKPKTDHTLKPNQESICINFTVKNTGSQEWPSAFMIYLLKCSDPLVNSADFKELIKFNPVFDAKVKPGSSTSIEVVLQLPKFSGKLTYTFAMHTMNYITFGEPFEFTIISNDNPSKKVANPQAKNPPHSKFIWRTHKEYLRTGQSSLTS